MTVNYSSEVTNCYGVGNFLKLLARWRGSIFKIIWPDLLIYLAIYYSLNLIYFFVLTEDSGRKHFSNIVTYFERPSESIPLSFVLGFYVNVVYNRWWSQYSSIPYPDNIAILVGASIHGKDEKARMIRRTIVRYTCAAFTLTLRMTSPKVKKRFPTLDHFVHAGLLTNEERSLMEELDCEFPSYAKYWLPLAWAANVTTRARAEGIIQHELGLKDILEELNSFRGKCKTLLDYDWICVPLVYTQVVTLAVYLYFLFTAIGSQFKEGQEDMFMFHLPFRPLVEFFFYMGWLKVAESLINPFGEDDDDFEVVWMIDRHLQVGYLLVDKIHAEHPVLTKDVHWKKIAPHQLPFTVASEPYMFEQPVESTNALKLHQNDQDLIIPDWTKEQVPINRSGFRNLKKLFTRRRNNPEDVKLRRIPIPVNNREFAWDEFNLYEGEPAEMEGEEPEKHTGNTEEFEKLRKQRLGHKKDDLLKWLEILQEDKERVKAILDDMYQ